VKYNDQYINIQLFLESYFAKFSALPVIAITAQDFLGIFVLHEKGLSPWSNFQTRGLWQ